MKLPYINSLTYIMLTHLASFSFINFMKIINF